MTRVVQRQPAKRRIDRYQRFFHIEVKVRPLIAPNSDRAECANPASRHRFVGLRQPGSPSQLNWPAHESTTHRSRSLSLRTPALAAVVAAILASHTPGAAQAQAALPEISVSVTRERRSVDETTSTVTVISAEEIDKHFVNTQIGVGSRALRF